MMIEQFIREHIESTATAYKCRLLTFEQFSKGKRITTQLLEDWVSEMKERGLARSTISAYFETVREYLSWEAAQGKRKAIDIPKPKLPAPSGKQRECITREELGMIMGKTDPKSFWPLMIQLGWETGLRLGDIAMLSWTHVYLDGFFIRVTPAKTVRFGKTLDIPISASLHVRLTVELRESRSSFVMPEAARLYQTDGHKSLSAQFSRLAKRAGVRKGFHNLRHSVVTRMIENGANPAVVASITGHSLKQIMQYAHPSLETKRHALGGIGGGWENYTR